MKKPCGSSKGIQGIPDKIDKLMEVTYGEQNIRYPTKDKSEGHFEQIQARVRQE